MNKKWALVMFSLPLAAVLTIATKCGRSDTSSRAWSLPQPVRVAGCVDLFPELGTWLPAETNDGTAAILARDGDLLLGNKDSNFLIYREGDGPVLTPAFEKWGVRLAGKVVSVSLTQGENGTAGGCPWLEQASPGDLAAIRLIQFPKEPAAAPLPALQRLAAANPRVALVCDDLDKPNAAFVQALPLFRPRLLALSAGDMVDAQGRSLLADQAQVETLLISGDSGSLEFLRTLPNLRRVWIGGWDPGKTGPLPPGLTALRSLILTAPEITDLSAVSAAPPELEELSLAGCRNLADVTGLARFSGLKTLMLTGNEKVLDLSGLARLRHLQWVGLPPKISQDQFAGFLQSHPDLRILEMVKCENVTDLAPLRALKGLEGLILIGSYKNLEVLSELKSLRFVGVPEEAFTQSPDQVAAIRKALPNALLVQVKGFCLGSGWILLLIPAVWLGRSLWRRWASGPRHA